MKGINKLIVFFTTINFATTINLILAANEFDTCETETCEKIGKEILASMDLNVNPCDNFYQFVCGNYGEKISSEDQVENPADSPVTDELHEVIKNNISDNDPETFKKLKKLFDFCENDMINQTLLEQITSRDISTFDQLMLMKKSDWYYFWTNSGKSDSEFNLAQLITKLKRARLPYDMLFKWEIIHLSNDYTNQYFHLGPTDLKKKPSLNIFETVKKIFTQPDDVSLYLNDFKKAFNELEISFDEDILRSDIKNMFEFEENLVKLPRFDDDHFDKFTISELEEFIPFLPWLDVLNAILYPDSALENNDSILVENFKFFFNYAKLLSKTSPRTLATFAFWQLWQRNLMEREINRNKNDETSVVPCMYLVHKVMPVALYALYARKVFDKSKKEIAENIKKNIGLKFENNIKTGEWLDEKQKIHIIQRFEQIKSILFYSSEIFDDKKLDDLYSGLTIINPNDPLFRIELENFTNGTLIKSLREMTEESLWKKLKLSYNTAYYAPWLHSLIYSIDGVSNSILTQENLGYLNYGEVGSIMGHEMMHGMDHTLNDFGENAVLFEENRIDCLHNYYTQLGVNASQSIHEILADHAGINLAYEAYASMNLSEPKLPGLQNYTNRQMFWISFGHAFCEEKLSPEEEEEKYKNDEHPPNRLRVLGLTSNSPDFSMDFRCSYGSFMNPTAKCLLI